MYQVECMSIYLETLLAHKDFFDAIDQSVLNLYPKKAIPILSMGSGTDSGVIAASLWSQDLDFKLICFQANEDLSILNKRLQLLNKDTFTIEPQPKDNLEQIYNEMESIGYKKGEGTGIGAGLVHFMLSKYITSPFMFSGLGTDELYTGDITLLFRFLKRAHMSYDWFEVDVQYPLLTTEVYKEYLRLDPELRSDYKQPFREYMKSKNFPIDYKKRSFSYFADSS